MGSYLRELRTAFGWTQERLAEALGKDTKTIGRWERGKTREPLSGTLIETVARDYLSGRTTRLGAYAEAMISPGLKIAIDQHPGLRFLLIERDLVLIRASAYAVKAFPLIHTIMGVSMRPFIAERYRQMHERVLAEPREGIIAVKGYAHYDASKLRWHPICWREYVAFEPTPGIFDVSGRDITREEYEAQTEKIVVIRK